MTGVTAAAEAEAGGEAGLFAALLALLGPQATAADGEIPAPAAPTEGAPVAAAPLIDVLKLVDSATMETTEGKSLLNELGDALIAINDAVEAGQPIDPALEKKLNDILDAVAVYLGTFTPPPPTIDPNISALASGEGILPTAPGTEPPLPAPPPEGDAVQIGPLSDGLVTPAEAEIALTDIAPVADTEPAAPAVPSPDEAPAHTPLPAAVVRLGELVEQLSSKLEAQSPELANKLQSLASSLKSGAAPAEFLAELGFVNGASEPEIGRIIDMLSEPRPKTTPAVASQPFTPPDLELPDAMTAIPKAAKNEPEVATELPGPDATQQRATEPEIATPGVIARTSREPQATAPEPKPTDASTMPQPPIPGDNSAAPAASSAQPAAPAARTVHAAYQAPVQQLNLPQVAFEVVRHFEAGSSRFQIRLDPPELGRIDVKLDVDKSGAVNARMTVERPETLDLMQRDQRALQQALQQAGLDTNKTSLEFSLRQNPFAQQGSTTDNRGQQPNSTSGGGSPGGDEPSAEVATTTYRGTASAGGVNLFV